MHKLLQNSVFSPRSARFAIFALGALLFSNFQENLLDCVKQSQISTFCQFVQDSVFSPRDHHVFSFSHGVHYLLAFSAKYTSLCKTAFSAHGEHVLSFLHMHTTFERFSAKFASLYKTAFSARDQHVSSFSHWAHYLLPIFSKMHGFVQNSVFRLRPARFVNSALGAPLLSHLQQCARACTKQKFSARDQHV